MKRLLSIGIILLFSSVTLMAGAADFSYYSKQANNIPQYTMNVDGLTISS